MKLKNLKTISCRMFNTETVNIKKVLSKNNKPMISGNYSICGRNKVKVLLIY